MTATPYQTVVIYSGSPSLHSSYTPLSSTPSSPASYTSTTPTSYLTNYTPVSSPLSIPSPYSAQSFTPSDTIRDLLAQDPSLQHANNPCISSDTSKLTPRGDNNPLKRKSGDIDVMVLETSIKRPAVTKCSSRRKVSATVKKERKRDQNKTAALRYRQKKKEERSDVGQQEQELKERNSELRSTLKGLEVEVGYLKRLWSEMELAKRARGH